MRKKHIVSIGCILTYIIGYIIIKHYFAQGKIFASYTAGWLVHRHRYFLFIWVASLAFALKEKYATAIATTAGCFIGMVLGDMIGEYIISVRVSRMLALIEAGEVIDPKQVQDAYMHYGIIPIWFIVVGIAVGIGIVLDGRYIKRKI